MKTAILLGAGSSVPAGFPSTESLTEQILSGSGIRRYTDGTYSINDNLQTDEKSAYVNRVIQHIHRQVDRYFIKMEYTQKHANYENVYYIIDQACDEKSGESENPAIHDYMNSLWKDIEPLAKEAEMEYKDLLEESRNYIADVVWGSLNHPACSPDHLKALEAACKFDLVSSISTLCHDTHVETHLEAQGISLEDGFSEEELGVRYWSNDFSSSDKIPFLKLHGSVNWFRLRLDSSESFYDDRIGIPLDEDHEHTKGKDGQFQISLDGRPLLLIGTFNKIPDYTRGIFRVLHHQFHQTLLKPDQLLVCGYSFGDKGINARIIEWYYAERGRRLLIIHRYPEELVRSARGAIRKKWDEWVNCGGVGLICKNFECVEEGELLGYLKGET